MRALLKSGSTRVMPVFSHLREKINNKFDNETVVANIGPPQNLFFQAGTKSVWQIEKILEVILTLKLKFFLGKLDCGPHVVSFPVIFYRTYRERERIKR